MADARKNAADDTVLVATVMVRLLSGESFELLPFEDAADVKARVNGLLADWAKSGFLIRGSDIVPWHQVQRVEAVKIEELSRDESALRRTEWEAKETARLQQSFWRTKKEPNEEKNGGEDQGQRSAA
jgi:hypothetical protein